MQAPQLLGSLVTLEQVQVSTPQQARSGNGQPHWPFSHCRPSAVQLLPQPPQLLGSVLGSMQAPLPQRRRGGKQVLLEQSPLEQVSPLGQGRLQPPQLLGSVLMSTQLLAQVAGLVQPVRPPEQVMPLPQEQLPFWQT